MEQGEPSTNQNTNNPSEGAEGDARQRSSIAFPYADLEDAEQIAVKIHGNVGGGTCEDDQLAAWLGLSPKSSGYRVRLAAARLFGVIESPSAATYQLSELGKQIVDPQQSRAARVSAFLNVPLFAKMYEQHKGGVIPPSAAFERTIEGAGVAPKQKTRARQILERSAEYAGFFEQGKNRLVKPGIAETGVKQEQRDQGAGGGGGGGGADERLDPMLVGLIDKLPRGSAAWPLKDRITWLQAATVIFQLVYGTESDIDVKTKQDGGQARKPQPSLIGAGTEGLDEDTES
jgi:hypothetical protein